MSENFLMMALITGLGLLVGSFLNVVIYRLPIMMDKEEKAYAWWVLNSQDDEEAEKNNPYLGERFNLMFPPSRCPKCERPIRAWENIPIISWLIQGKRCVGCREPISGRYPFVEGLTGFLSLLVAIKFQDNQWAMGLALIFTWSLVALFFIDADTQLLPDSITLPLLWLGLGAGIFQLFVPLYLAVAGAIIGYGLLWAIFWLFKLLTGKEGMGYGDFKLLACLLAWQGVQALPFILFLSAGVGIAFGVANRLGFGEKMAFGPFLAIAGWLSFMYGDTLLPLLGFA